MSVVDLLQPILDHGLQRNNFFNGRLLSAEDLRAEQEASRAQDAQLARALGGATRHRARTLGDPTKEPAFAIGGGVAWGLDVSIVSAGRANPRVRVTRGLALTSLGALLPLPEDTEVALVPETVAAEVAAGLFADCPADGAPPSLAGDGAYVLTIAPTSGYSGSAPVSDPNATAVGRGACGARFTVEGVRFRLVPIPLAQLDGIGATLRARAIALLPPATGAAREQLRNVLAHLCFGTESLGGFFADPLRSRTDGRPAWSWWGLLDAMRDRRDLTDCDVPLALVVLTGDGISFVDVWAARRRLLPAGAIHAWQAVAGPRRIAEGEAAFLQFQAQLEEVKGLATPNAIVASGYFDVLPAAGWLPTGTGGFDWKRFLGPHAPPMVTPVDAALLRGIVERSWLDEPFALDSVPFTKPPTPLHVYEVPGASSVVFARSHRGAVRVFLTPTPAGAEVVEAAATARTGALTRGAPRAGNELRLMELAPGVQSLAVTAPDYQAVAAQDVTAVGGRTIDVGVTLVPLPNGYIVVTAVDRRTNESIGRFLTSVRATGGGITRAGTYDASADRWRIPDLPAATYAVDGSATEYQLYAPVTVGPTARNTATPATLLFTHVVPLATRPEECVRLVEWGRPQLRDVRICLVLAATEFEESYFYGGMVQQPSTNIPSGKTFRVARRAEADRARTKQRYVAGTGEIVYVHESWAGMVPVDPVPDAVRRWLREWQKWFAETLHDESIARTDPILFLDPNYVVPANAKQVPETPPGYAVFAHFGVPVSITPQERITKAPVEIGRAGIRGLRPDVVEGLQEAGFLYIDQLPGLWTEILVDVTGAPVINPVTDPAPYLVEDAVRATERINVERRYYDGVDQEVAEILTRNGIDDDVALANADPDVLGEKLGSVGFAVRLIGQARQIVPAASWSLESLGLTPGQARDLAAHGIDSKGTLANGAGHIAGRAAIADVLGISGQSGAEREAAADALAHRAITEMAASSIELAPKRGVESIPAVGAVEAGRLRLAGFTTTEALAAADPAAVAAATGLGADAATKLVGDAKEASASALTVGLLAPVSRAEERRLGELVGGKATINALAGKTAAELAPAFNGDLARAGAVLGGIQAGLAARGGRP